MKFIKGRDNLSVTVYVPWDCPNACKFCSSKEEYKRGTDLEKVKANLLKVRNSPIREVVFTGGEPMMNLEVLKELVKIVDNKKVYINTTFIKKDVVDFVKFVNKTRHIKAINISRHGTSFAEDSKTLCNIAEDDLIKFIEKPVKLNVVIPDNKIIQSIARCVLLRWKSFDNLKICFRTNFNDTSKENLHDLSDVNLETLSNLGLFEDRSYCDVCDTVSYISNNQDFMYHRGLPTTAITFANVTQVNDIIIFPDGQLAYDWDRKIGNIEEMCRQFNIVETPVKHFPQFTQEIVPGSCSIARPVSATTVSSIGSCGIIRTHC